MKTSSKDTSREDIGCLLSITAPGIIQSKDAQPGRMPTERKELTGKELGFLLSHSGSVSLLTEGATWFWRRQAGVKGKDFLAQFLQMNKI